MENMDYSYFINKHSGRRRPALTRELTKRLYNAPKEIISLAEGMPSESTFPFEQINVTMKDGSSFTLEGQSLGQAMQYLPSQGMPPLLHTLKEFTKYVHNPPHWELRDVIITSGSQCGISKSIEMCVQDGSPVLVQNPLYTGTEIVLKPFNTRLLAVPQDHYGIIPQKLLDILEDWRLQCSSDASLAMPKIMYLNPTAANPTGTTMPLERRKDIYQICCQYNILILEDDAYYFLDFHNGLSKSFLSLDTEGRVLRFDSFSKVLGGGLRVGWVTGPKKLIQNIELHIQSSYLHCSSLTQSIVEHLIKSWGFDKLLAHFASVRKYYKIRRDLTIASMERHLKGLCEWSVPSGGMFVWIQVREVSDVYEMLMTRGLKKNIALAPGHAFMADPTRACNYVRASYSRASPKQIDQAMKRLAEVVKEEQRLLRDKICSVDVAQGAAELIFKT